MRAVSGLRLGPLIPGKGKLWARQGAVALQFELS